MSLFNNCLSKNNDNITVLNLLLIKGGFKMAYKFRPEAVFPMSRIGKIYNVSEIETTETVLA